MRTFKIPLRAVLYKQESRWVAHCLEFDLIGDGDTLRDALAALSDAIEIQIKYSTEHRNPENLFTPADGKIFQMFAAGKRIATGEVQIKVSQPDNISIESLDAREYDSEYSDDDALCV